MGSEQFSLCWDNFHKNMSSGMNLLLENEDLVDVTLAVEGKHLKAHKMVLSVCSPYFKELFKENPCKHPIVFMKDVSFQAMNNLLQFMYQGEVQVSQDNLTVFIKTAEALQIKGLTSEGNNSSAEENDTVEEEMKFESNKKHIQPIRNSKKNIRTTSVSSSSPSGSSTKRQRLSSVETLTKTNCIPTTNEELIQFKMEPYEQTQELLSVDNLTKDDSADDEVIDEGNMDDTDDYTMIENKFDEPQASTSVDRTTGEGQAVVKLELPSGKVKRKKNMPRYIVDGFVFHVNITKGTPPMIYLRCMEYKRLGCHARAVIPYEGTIQDIKTNKPHNHPPDFAAEEKIIFIRELKEFMLKQPNVRSRSVYNTLSSMYPNAARETPYDSIKHKMNRWRRQTHS